jgi:FdhD protein
MDTRRPLSRLVWSGGAFTQAPRVLPEETAVALSFNGTTQAVMMATPDDLEDFATGFSLTEGIVQTASEIRSITTEPVDDGVAVTIDLVPDRFREHLARRRNLSGRTSCGLCGIDSMDALPAAKALGKAPVAVSAEAIHKALLTLDTRQPLGTLTRAVHAAAWCNHAGDILAVREDVGRHNALDKLIGHLLRGKQSPAEGFILITSRASFEMIEKAAIFGAGTIVAISAPTSLAVKRARELGVTLIAVARRDAAIVFAGALAPHQELAAS